MESASEQLVLSLAWKSVMAIPPSAMAYSVGVYSLLITYHSPDSMTMSTTFLPSMAPV